MEQFIKEVEQYCADARMKPQALLRKSVNSRWGQWGDWKAGRSTPTLALVDRIRDFMRKNPPVKAEKAVGKVA